MITALLVMAGIAVVLGAMLGFASIRFKVKGDPLVDKIDAILPQTQCGQCGFPGCKPYAQAIAKGEAEINQCPPGGEEGIRKLADLLGKEFKPLSAEHGTEQPKRAALIAAAAPPGCPPPTPAPPPPSPPPHPPSLVKICNTSLDGKKKKKKMSPPPPPVLLFH